MQHEIKSYAESRGIKEYRVKWSALEIYSTIGGGDRQRTLDILKDQQWVNPESDTAFDEQNGKDLDLEQDILREERIGKIISSR